MIAGDLARWERVLQADCPTCGAEPGERCKRSGHAHHAERYGALTTGQPITEQEEETLP